MGQINVEGVGIVDIKGDTPTFSEMQEIQNTAKELRSQNIVEGEAENETENFFKTALQSPRITQVGLTTLQGPAAAIVSLIEKSVGTDQRGGAGDFVAATAAKTKLTINFMKRKNT